MGLSDPFGQTYEGSRQALGSFGEALQTTAASIAARKQQERELQMKRQLQQEELGMKQQLQKEEYGLKGQLAGEEAKYKQQYPTVQDLFYSKQLAKMDGGQEEEKTPEQIKTEFIARNPQYKIEDIVLKPKTTSYKGITKTEQVPEVDKTLFDQRTTREKHTALVKDSAIDALDTISKVRAGIGYFGVGGMIPAMPGLQPEKVKWQANTDKLLSGLILDVMNKMKSASRTGATGFGQLNQSELAVLKNASTALKKTMDPKDAEEILNQMEEKLKKITGDIKQISSDEEYNSLPSGTEFIDPEGQKRTKP